MAAAQCLGGIPVPLYQDAVAQEMVFVFQNAEIAFALVEDQEQVDKLLEIQAAVPEARAHLLRRPARPAELRAARARAASRACRRRGASSTRATPTSSHAEVEKGQPSDTAAMFFTSGTTGQPKGVVLTHANLITAGRAWAPRWKASTPDEEVLAYLPPAWIGQNIFSYAQPYVVGFCVSCPESAETVMTDMREIGPTYYFAPPRVLEALLTQVTIRMEDAGAAQARAVPLLHGARAARRRRRSSTRRSRWRSSTGCCTGSATCSSTGRCATCSA